MRSKLFGPLLVIVILLSAGLMACSTQEKKPAEPATPVVVQLSWTHDAQFAGLYAAINQGYYLREGLSVTLSEGGLSNMGYVRPVEQVTNGNAAFGIVDGQSLLRAHDIGLPVVMIAALFQRTPRAFIALEESGIVRPHDFVRKRVGQRSDVAVVTNLLYEAAGIDASTVIEVTNPQMLTTDALIKGEIDVIPGLVTSEAILLEQSGHPVNLIVVSDYGIEDFQDIIFTTQAMIDDNPDLVERFLRATLAGVKYAVDNPEEAALLVRQYAPANSLQFYRASMASTVPLLQVAGVPIGSIDTPAWNSYIDILFQAGLLTSTEKAAGSYNVEFVNRIYGEQ